MGEDSTKSPETCRIIGEKLLRWFGENARDLPWRKRYGPYEVWISEIMLQQTRIGAMLPYYRRWMERFPDAASVAEAPEDELFRYWEGLGYYARAKNLHRAAKLIVSRHGGKIPDDFDSLRELPGIGRYTAGAIMSFAHNADYPAADANAARVFARLFDISAPSGTKEFGDAVWRRASETLPGGRARDFNQALMDFGSTVCLPGEPSCRMCPLASCCRGREAGVAAMRPVAGRKKVLVPVARAAGVLISERKVLIRKRPESGLMPGLWEFPGGTVEAGEHPEEALGRIWLRELGVRPGPVEELAVVKHTHTSFRVTLYAYLCRRTAGEPPAAPDGARLRWAASSELRDLAFPSAHRRVVRALMKKAPDL